MRVVSEEEAKQDPYPVVYVENSGAYRELTDSEKSHLETDYHGADGSRPHVKLYYRAKTPDGRLRGYLLRSNLPPDLKPGETLTDKSPWYALDIRQWIPGYSTLFQFTGFVLVFMIVIIVVSVLAIGSLVWMLSLYVDKLGPVGLVLFLLSLGAMYQLFRVFDRWRKRR